MIRLALFMWLFLWTLTTKSKTSMRIISAIIWTGEKIMQVVDLFRHTCECQCGLSVWSGHGPCVCGRPVKCSYVERQDQ